MGWEKDLPLGERLIACFQPFLEQLVGSELAPRTIQNHVDNLWALGGEIIRDLNEDPSLRKIPVEQLLHNVVHADGGPMLHNGSEEEQRSLDSTCRKFHRFLTHTGPARAPRGEKGSRRKSRP